MGTDELYPAERPVAAQRATAAGHGDAFPHRTGHGSGLDTTPTELIAL